MCLQQYLFYSIICYCTSFIWQLLTEQLENIVAVIFAKIVLWKRIIRRKWKTSNSLLYTVTQTTLYNGIQIMLLFCSKLYGLPLSLRVKLMVLLIMQTAITWSCTRIILAPFTISFSIRSAFSSHNHKHYLWAFASSSPSVWNALSQKVAELILWFLPGIC